MGLQKLVAELEDVVVKLVLDFGCTGVEMGDYLLLLGHRHGGENYIGGR
jgi:hypothetical protein